MPKGKEVILQGKAKWVHTKRPDKYGKWTCTLYPNAESLAIINEMIAEGIKNELKKDDDGYYMSFGRYVERTDRNGRKYNLQPVEVMNADRTLFEGYVGNGSDVTIKLDYYGGIAPTKQPYKAARLAGIRIDNLVPYTPESGLLEAHTYSIGGLDKVPPQVKPTW